MQEVPKKNPREQTPLPRSIRLQISGFKVFRSASNSRCSGSEDEVTRVPTTLKPSPLKHRNACLLKTAAAWHAAASREAVL